MTWFKVDDGFSDHPKVLALRSKKGWQSALALWTLAGAWSSKHLTDGVIAKALVTHLGCTDKDAELLVDCGLWDRSADGFSFHDWTSRNPSRSDVETKREKTRKKVAEWRRNQECNQVSEEQCNPAPYPSRPVPTIPDPPNPLVEPPGLAELKPHPARLVPELKRLVGEEFDRLRQPGQGAHGGQWTDAATRAQQAADQGHFPDALTSAAALAKAAVKTAVQPGGRLGFALQQAPFTALPTAQPQSTTNYGRPDEYRPDGSIKTQLGGVR